MELFNDYKNRYYRCTQNMINEIYNGKDLNQNDIRKILQEAYLEDEVVLIDELVKGKFFDYDKKTGNARLRVNSKVPIRLNDLELAYLKMFVYDEVFNKVLDDEILQKLRENLKDVESLDCNRFWTRENIDKFGDNIQDKAFRNKILILQKAILEHKYIKYNSQSRKGDVFENKIAYPYKIEYSIKNNKYRLVVYCDDRAIKMNIDNISKIEVLDDRQASEEEKNKIEEFINNKKNIEEPLMLKIEDNANSLDRCFNLFAAYDKGYYYDEDGNLILNVYYHDFDEAEIVRDILSLGKSAVVLKPKRIRDKVIDRILRNFDKE